MAIISFAYTTKEFLDGKKTCTRRKWSRKQFLMWRKFWYGGKLIHDAYDKSPRVDGKKIGRFRLICPPVHEQLCSMAEHDLIAEGGTCSTIKEFCELINADIYSWVTVIRFEKVDDEFE